MFDDKQNDNPLAEDLSSNQPVQKPPVDLPASNQPSVVPKPGREAPNTEDIFADTDKSGVNKIKAQPAGIEQAGGLASARQAEAVAGPPEPLSELPDDLEEEGTGSKKFFWIGFFALIIILAFGGWFAYSQFFSAVPQLNLPKVDLDEISPANINKQFEDQIINLNLNKNTNQEKENTELDSEIQACPELVSLAPDWCDDGVIVPSGVDERGCQQLPESNRQADIDSDKDGLTDSQEEEYGTDASEPDSDGDELFDREEVIVYQTDPLNPDTDGDGYLDGD